MGRMHRCASLAATALLASLLSPTFATADLRGDDVDPITDVEPGDLEVGYTVERASFIAASFCLPDLTVQSLGTMFDSEPGGIIGADYPRTLVLPNGNVLWTFQDARIRTPDGGARYVHNIGMMQVGLCFSLLVGGSSSHPEAWLFEEHTAPEYRWFWPLDGELGDDGNVYILAVEMRERGDRYLTRTEPSGTYIARFNPNTWNIEFYGQPANRGNDLYGWSIESDDEWTYLFAQCHRQFGYDPAFGALGHDRSCTDRVTVGRVPKGRLFDAPTYWNGSSWSTVSTGAQPIIERRDRFANPTQFVRKNHWWLAITKVDDWWGQVIVIERALHPTGPYVEIERRRALIKCDGCNSYFSSWIDGQNLGGPNDVLITSLSHNRWDGEVSWAYRPSFDVVFPPFDHGVAPAMRCSLGHCT